MINGINEHIVTHDQTVSEWLSQWILIDDFTSRGFLDLKLVSGKIVNITNLDRIKHTCNKEELASLNDSLPDNVLIKSGTSVGLPNFALRRQLARPKVVPDISR